MANESPEVRFAFGRNWSDYSASVTDEDVRRAACALEELVGARVLRGARFLDIGSGSGIHSAAAAALGVREVVAVDLDEQCVETTRRLLSSRREAVRFRVEVCDVLEGSLRKYGEFDVVYSWGVLHHTGDLNGALRRAAQAVAAEGLFVFALYRRTWMDWFWKIEKRWYAQAGPRAQGVAQIIYRGAFGAALRVRGQTLKDYVRRYAYRGMRFDHDVHDWLGGFPYETATPEEVESTLRELGFRRLRCKTHRGRFLGRDLGLLGSGCDEYVYQRGSEKTGQ